MNPVMWNNPATQNNYRKLLDRGIKFIQPEQGDMACGEFGTGRLPEPKLIVEEITKYLNYKKNYKINLIIYLLSLRQALLLKILILLDFFQTDPLENKVML